MLTKWDNKRLVRCLSRAIEIKTNKIFLKGRNYFTEIGLLRFETGRVEFEFI